MFGLKIFVRVQTFRRVPPVLPRSSCHPDVIWCDVSPMSPVSPVRPVSPVSPVRLAHLWVDFRVIYIEKITRTGKTVWSSMSRICHMVKMSYGAFTQVANTYDMCHIFCILKNKLWGQGILFAMARTDHQCQEFSMVKMFYSSCTTWFLPWQKYITLTIINQKNIYEIDINWENQF